MGRKLGSPESSSSTSKIKVTVDTATKALRFEIGALVQVDIPAIRGTHLKTISLRVQGKGYGTFEGNQMKGGFVVSLPDGLSPFTGYAENSEAFKRLKQFTGMPLSLSAIDNLPLAVFGDAKKKVSSPALPLAWSP